MFTVVMVRVCQWMTLGEYLIGDHGVRIGEIAGAPFYMSRAQFDYWKDTQLIIDVVPGWGGMFSHEGGKGVRFLTRSRLFTDDELATRSRG